MIENAGEATTIHAHANGHLTRGDKRSAVYLIGADGVERAEILRGPLHSFFIPAGIQHMVIALEPRTVFECLFCHYDETGKFMAEPENARPPDEVAVAILPGLMRDLLAREGVADPEVLARGAVNPER